MRAYRSQKYVGVSSTSTGTDNIKLFSSMSNSTKWYIYEKPTGECLLEPLGANATFLYAPNTTTTARLQLSAMEAPTTDNIKWRILTATAEQSYSYVNYYDSSFQGNSTLIGNIGIANNFSNLVFTECFDTSIYMASPASLYSEPIYSCGSGECCEFCCGEHCLSVDDVIGRICYNPREENHVYVIWMSRDNEEYCQDELDDIVFPSGNTKIAKTHNMYPVIAFISMEGIDNPQLQKICMAITLVHETLHAFKMEDVYGNSTHSEANETGCIMGYFNAAIAEDFYLSIIKGQAEPFCQQCMDKIFAECYPFVELEEYS